MENKKKTVSIAMTTFNGKQYVVSQIESIVPHLLEGDELIISDDGSTDGTLEILQDYAQKNEKIKVFNGPKKGVVKNFEFALSKSTGDIILISDQDDIWLPDKLEVMRNAFLNDDNLFLVLHDMYISNDYQILNGIEGISSYERRKRKHGVVNNWIYSGYFGCCMGLSKTFLNKILPFPRHVNLYDQWIGMIGEHYKKTIFIDDKLIIHREHSNNVSKEKTSIFFKIKTRLVLLLGYLEKKKIK